MANADWTIALHGGAGPLIVPEVLTELDAKMEEALQVCFASIEGAKDGMDVVVAGLAHLEECELFDCGYGSLIRDDGSVHLDVSLVDGQGSFFAIAGLEKMYYPSRLALHLLRENKGSMFTWYGEHVRNIVDGLSKEQKAAIGIVPNHAAMRAPFAKEYLDGITQRNTGKKLGGTVGCVVRDPSGRVFVGTSTGGTPFAPVGRIGDTPVIGMGSFADDAIAGISATGFGEAFMSSASVPFVAAKLQGRAISGSLELVEIIDEEITRLERRFPGVEAGMIAVTKNGCVASAHNTELMPVAIGKGDVGCYSKIVCKNGVLSRDALGAS